ncbi:MAG: penicillin-binding protein [Firmicutes bacterium]|nr:penicillin-binding protein [Bacillota bacterium]
MKKLEGRAFLCLTLAMMLVIGLGAFVYRLARDGGDWASFYANQHIYKSGKLTVGAIYDRTGIRLLSNDEDGSHYADDGELRKANFHVVGDKGSNVTTAANSAFRKHMVGYNIIGGTNHTLLGKNRRVTLTIDAELNRTAYRALAGREGFISVYNWKTGDIVCMVSAPAADPAAELDGSKLKEGTFINKVLSSTYTPGSTFKLVTAAAAIEQIEGLNQWEFTCDRTYDIDGEEIICPENHGKVDFAGALAKSCNGAFAALTVELGSEAMEDYVKKLGLTERYDVDGIKAAEGSFNFDTYDINLGWAGIGQFEDQVNPLSMMVYMGAIAGEGNGAQPRLIYDKNLSGTNVKKVKLLSAGTARQLKELMRNNVLKTYGEGNYEGLDLHAKSGTAETGPGKKPNSWFCGFSGDYAFVVCIEEGGYGSAVAGPVAGKLLRQIHNK